MNFVCNNCGDGGSAELAKFHQCDPDEAASFQKAMKEFEKGIKKLIPFIKKVKKT